MAEAGPHVAIITGLSGAGRTTTSKFFEDLGYRVVDNLPAELLRDLAQLVVGIRRALSGSRWSSTLAPATRHVAFREAM